MINQDYIDEVENIDHKASNKARMVSLDNLSRFKTSKNSLDEFNTKCAYIFLEYIDTIRPQYIGYIPSQLNDYYQLDEKERKKIDNSFWKQSYITDFLEHKQRVISWNIGQIHNLITFLRYIPKEDKQSRQKFRNKILEFNNKGEIIVKEYDGKIRVEFLTK